MRQKRKARLRSQAGETLAEVLISVLVSSFALIILAQMISSSRNIIQTSENKMGEYYEESNKLVLLEPTPAAKTFTLKLDDDTSFDYTVELYENKPVGNKTVSSYVQAPEEPVEPDDPEEPGP